MWSYCESVALVFKPRDSAPVTVARRLLLVAVATPATAAAAAVTTATPPLPLLLPLLPRGHYTKTTTTAAPAPAGLQASKVPVVSEFVQSSVRRSSTSCRGTVTAGIRRNAEELIAKSVAAATFEPIAKLRVDFLAWGHSDIIGGARIGPGKL